jgi:hypothetical protein
MCTRCGPAWTRLGSCKCMTALGGHAHRSQDMAQGVDDDLVAPKEEVAA